MWTPITTFKVKRKVRYSHPVEPEKWERSRKFFLCTSVGPGDIFLHQFFLYKILKSRKIFFWTKNGVKKSKKMV